MTQSLLARQDQLPAAIPLIQYAPNRVPFSWQGWDPTQVRSPRDLPQYLILGDLDCSTFEASAAGWSARWQGTEGDTHFDVIFKAGEGRYEICQTWRGLDGGLTLYPSRFPLTHVIGQALYRQFPTNWNNTAKQQLEAAYQLSRIEPGRDGLTFCGIPDGAFRTIVFPVAVRNLRPICEWLADSISESRLTYPVSVEAKLVFQALSYVEGKAPEWTRQGAALFIQSLLESGIAPQGLPIRETADDGSAAWSLRREVYFLFIGIPFAGLADFLERMSNENGPIRTASHPSLRFELRPIVMPAEFEFQAKSLTFWDRLGTTRSFLRFAPPEGGKSVPVIQDVVDDEKNSANLLQRAEGISAGLVEEIERMFNRTTGGATS